MKKFFTFLTACLSIWLTFYLNHYIGLGSVMSSSLIGLIGGLILKKYKGVNFTASFIGMSSVSVLLSPVHALFSGLFLFAFWSLLKDYFQGLGGKFGTIALLSITSFSLFLYFITPGYEFNLFNSSNYSINGVKVMSIVITSILSVMSMHFLRDNLVKDCVINSSLIGLISSLFLNNLTASVAYSASFAGMCSSELLNDYKRSVVIGSILGFVYLIMLGLFPGYGGKLGFIGLISTFVYKKFAKIL